MTCEARGFAYQLYNSGKEIDARLPYIYNKSTADVLGIQSYHAESRRNTINDEK